jgi:hypothetical protein
MGLDARERHLAEDLARAEQRERHRLAELGRDTHQETPARDEVERVGWIAVVVDDLAAIEAPSPSDAQQEPDIFSRHISQQMP